MVKNFLRRQTGDHGQFNQNLINGDVTPQDAGVWDYLTDIHSRVSVQFLRILL